MKIIFIKSTRVLHILFSILFIFMNQKIEANTLKQTEGFYLSGKFEQASTSANQALKNPKLKLSERARLHKINGISLFMLKKLPASADSFQKALDLDPKTQVSKNEVLDESVVKFFNDEKTKWNKNKSSNSQRLSPDTNKAKIIAQNKTYIFIESNVPSASISIDGILAGNPGTKIETDPGTRVIELSAPGYVPRKIKSKLTARTENKLKIDLQKPKPKPVPKKQNPSAAVAALPLPDPGIRSTKTKTPQEPAVDPSVASRDVASEFNLDAQTGGQTAGVGISKPHSAQPHYQGGYTQAPPAYMAPPSQPLYPAPYMNPYYQPGYGAPVYSAPVYPVNPYGAPMYQTPPPNYYMAPQTPVAPTPSYSTPSPAITESPSSQPPAPDYYEDAGDDAELIFGDSGNRKTKTSTPKKSSTGGSNLKSSKGKKTSSAKSANTYERPKLWIALLPFGAGQFQNQSYVLGSLFLGAEAFCLYQFYSSYSASSRVTSEANAVANDENYCDGSDDVDKCEEDRVAYLANSKKFVSSQDSTAQLSLIAFAGLWAAGVVEALINEPLPPTPKKSKRRRYGLGIYKPYTQSDPSLLAFTQNTDTLWQKNDWSIGPVLNPYTLEFNKGFGISFSQEW